MTTSEDRIWGLAWLALTLVLAGHVVDEALTDFLAVYNPAVESIRASVPWLPLPTFTFGTWIGGLSLALLLLLYLTRFALRGARWMRRLSYLYGTLMTANALLHISASLMLGRLMPGVVSSPLLLAAAVFLLAEVPRERRAVGAGV